MCQLSDWGRFLSRAVIHYLRIYIGRGVVCNHRPAMHSTPKHPNQADLLAQQYLLFYVEFFLHIPSKLDLLNEHVPEISATLDLWHDPAVTSIPAVHMSVWTTSL